LTSPFAGTVEARVVTVFRGPVNVDEALAASANIPLPAIRPAVEVTIAAMAAAYRRTGFITLRSLSVENVSTLSTGRERAEFGCGTRKLTTWVMSPGQVNSVS
jgi:hypothetical protein